MQAKRCRSPSAPSILLAVSLAARWGPNHALTSLHSSPPGASAGASHRHSLTAADAQLTLPPASHHHPASLCHLPTAQPPATHAGGPAPHPPHVCRSCHHTAQRQCSPPQWWGGQRTSGWPCKPQHCWQGRREEKREGKGCCYRQKWVLITCCATGYFHALSFPHPSLILLSCCPLGWEASGAALLLNLAILITSIQFSQVCERYCNRLSGLKERWPSHKQSAKQHGRNYSRWQRPAKAACRNVWAIWAVLLLCKYLGFLHKMSLLWSRGAGRKASEVSHCSM